MYENDIAFDAISTIFGKKALWTDGIEKYASINCNCA